jgi:glycosyltransferase involved in cell wall biosynthesis
MIVQAYIPEYRVPFFDGLKTELGQAGVDVRVAAVGASRERSMRGDDATFQVADFILHERRVGFGGSRARIRSLSSAFNQVQPDMIIFEQALKYLDTARSLAVPRPFRHQSIGLWGQGRAFSQPQGVAASAAMRFFTNRADWFFAYTNEGARHVVDGGFPVNRVTEVWNTIDTVKLQRELKHVDESSLTAFRRRHGLCLGQTGLFLGGVDEAKGMDFLLSSVESIAKMMPRFRLLVGGSGSMASRVRDMESNGAPLRYLGRVDGLDKAMALRAADVLLIPEWIGLVAIDSLTAGKPIVTTDHPSHSPEFGYLTPGRTVEVVPHTVSAYAESVVAILKDTQRLKRMQQMALTDATQHDLEGMVSRFARGVLAWNALLQ